MRLLALLSLLSLPVLAQGLPLKSGASSDLATIDTSKNLRVSFGPSTRATYTCSATALATTAVYSMALEAEASRGFRISRICIGSSAATAAAAQTVTLQRRTTASSGGSVATAEATASPSVSQHVPGTGNWTGRCAVTPTFGTAGAVLDGWAWSVGEIGAGAADPSGLGPHCVTYGNNGTQMPYVAAGTANGVSLNVTAAGAGGLAAGSIAITFIAE